MSRERDLGVLFSLQAEYTECVGVGISRKGNTEMSSSADEPKDEVPAPDDTEVISHKGNTEISSSADEPEDEVPDDTVAEMRRIRKRMFRERDLGVLFSLQAEYMDCVAVLHAKCLRSNGIRINKVLARQDQVRQDKVLDEVLARQDQVLERLGQIEEMMTYPPY